jgi:hypothetical protein
MRRWSSLQSLAICPLLMACATGPKILASRDVCHLAAKPATVVGLCGTDTPKVYQQCRIQVREGDVICDGALWERYQKGPSGPAGASTGASFAPR